MNPLINWKERTIDFPDIKILGLVDFLLKVSEQDEELELYTYVLEPPLTSLKTLLAKYSDFTMKQLMLTYLPIKETWTTP